MASPSGTHRAVLVLHGPNLNLLGQREPDVYGSATLTELDHSLIEVGRELGLEVDIRQTNAEGQMIDWIQRAGATHAGLVINPGGYSHTSVAIADALRAISIPVIEVHLSNLFERETFRHNSITAAASNGVIMGLGPLSYVLALHAVARRLDRDAGAQPSAP